MNVRPTYWFLWSPSPYGIPETSENPWAAECAGVGHRDHHVGIGGVLGGEDPAHLAPGLVHRDALHPRIGSRQVDELEDAEGRARAPGEVRGMEPAIVDPDQLAGLDLTDERGAHDVEGAGLRGDHEPLGQLPHGERPEAVRVPGGEDGALVRHHEAEGPFELGEDPHRRPLEVVMGHLRREHRGHEVGVGRGGGGATQPRDQLAGVHQVPVVPQRERPHAVVLEDGLGVVPGRGPGGRVAGVADGEVPLEGRQRGLVEDLGDQPEVLVDQDVVTVGDRDARRLLATVLLGEETEVGETGDVLARGPHPEQAAFVFGTLRSHLGSVYRRVSSLPGWLTDRADRSEGSRVRSAGSRPRRTLPPSRTARTSTSA